MVATFGAENLSFARWIYGFAVLFFVDIVWFAVAAKVYRLETDFFVEGSAKKREEEGTWPPVFFIAICAAVAAFTLSFIGADRRESGEAGALIGFTIFFVFNACVYYIINNMQQENFPDQKWRKLTAFIDTAYGTAIYALACMAINSA